MKLIVDSNKLQSDELKEYLERSSNNYVVLTDYVAMEAYKENTLNSIFKSMQVISQYPRQVIVLKNTPTACAQRGRSSNLQRPLIDQAQTNDFPTYIEHLNLAKKGHDVYQKELLEYGKEATSHLKKMLDDSERIREAILEFAKEYTKEERKIIREGDIPSREMIDKIVTDVLTLAQLLFEGHLNVRLRLSPSELSNTFIFRVALTACLFVLHFGAHGGAKDMRQDKLRNQWVDMYFVAYATYFDGILSGEVLVNKLHIETRIWLIAIFDCKLPSDLGFHTNTKND